MVIRDDLQMGAGGKYVVSQYGEGICLMPPEVVMGR